MIFFRLPAPTVWLSLYPPISLPNGARWKFSTNRAKTNQRVEAVPLVNRLVLWILTLGILKT